MKYPWKLTTIFKRKYIDSFMVDFPLSSQFSGSNEWWVKIASPGWYFPMFQTPQGHDGKNLRVNKTSIGFAGQTKHAKSVLSCFEKRPFKIVERPDFLNFQFYTPPQNILIASTWSFLVFFCMSIFSGCHFFPCHFWRFVFAIFRHIAGKATS